MGKDPNVMPTIVPDSPEQLTHRSRVPAALGWSLAVGALIASGSVAVSVAHSRETDQSVTSTQQQADQTQRALDAERVKAGQLSDRIGLLQQWEATSYRTTPAQAKASKDASLQCHTWAAGPKAWDTKMWGTTKPTKSQRNLICELVGETAAMYQSAAEAAEGSRIEGVEPTKEMRARIVKKAKESTDWTATAYPLPVHVDVWDSWVGKPTPAQMTAVAHIAGRYQAADNQRADETRKRTERLEQDVENARAELLGQAAKTLKEIK